MTWEKFGRAYRRVLMDGARFNNEAEEVVFPSGGFDLLEGRDFVCGYYLLAGQVEVDGTVYGPDTLLWITAGTSLPARSEHNLHAVYVGTKHKLPQGEAPELQVFVEPELEWSRPLTDGMTASRHMVRAEDWGVKLQTCIYTRGFRHAWHSHKFAHGIYVLEGMLRNDLQPHDDSFFGPGDFALTPANTEVLHEPASREGYVRYLFIGDGPFDFIVNGEDLYGK